MIYSILVLILNQPSNITNPSNHMTNQELGILKKQILDTTHDLNNCLFAAAAAATLINNMNEQPQISKYIDIVEKSCTQATLLSNNLESLIEKLSSQ